MAGRTASRISNLSDKNSRKKGDGNLPTVVLFSLMHAGGIEQGEDHT
jgi:hypothetical protein